MINLWDGYAIVADDCQFVLGKPFTREHKKRQRDETRMQDATYHPTLALALAAFHRQQLRECVRDNMLTLADAVATSAQIEKRIRDMMQMPNFEKTA